MHPNNVLARFVDGSSDGSEERALVDARQERPREKTAKKQQERATAKASEQELES